MVGNFGLQENQKYPQYCWEFHDRLWEALPEPLLKKKALPAVLGGRLFLADFEALCTGV